VRGDAGDSLRQKVEQELPSKDLMFLMGTVHRFPDQWLIISVIYPLKRPAAQGRRFRRQDAGKCRTQSAA